MDPAGIVAAAAAGSAAVGAFELAAALRWKTRWAERGVLGASGSTGAALTRVAVGMLVGVAAAVLGASPLLAAAAAAAGWYATLAVICDVTVLRVPREPALWVWLAGVGAAAASSWWTLLGAVTMTAVVVVALGVTSLLARRGLGMGDMRLLVALSPLAVWPAPSAAPLVGLLAAAAIQLVLRPLWRRAGIVEGDGYPFVPALLLGLAVGVAAAPLFG